MAERLTDKTALTTVASDADLFHVVDVSDTTSNAAGTSKKHTAFSVLAKGLRPIQGCYVLARTSGSTSTSVLAAGDLVMYVNASDAIIIALLKGAVTTIPDDLRDNTKAFTFIDQSPLL